MNSIDYVINEYFGFLPSIPAALRKTQFYQNIAVYQTQVSKLWMEWLAKYSSFVLARSSRLRPIGISALTNTSLVSRVLSLHLYLCRTRQRCTSTARAGSVMPVCSLAPRRRLLAAIGRAPGVDVLNTMKSSYEPRGPRRACNSNGRWPGSWRALHAASGTASIAALWVSIVRG